MFTYGLLLVIGAFVLFAFTDGPKAEFARRALSVFCGIALSWATAVWLGFITMQGMMIGH